MALLLPLSLNNLLLLAVAWTGIIPLFFRLTENAYKYYSYKHNISYLILGIIKTNIFTKDNYSEQALCCYFFSITCVTDFPNEWRHF